MKLEKAIAKDEIDLTELVKTIWSKRMFIAKVTSVFIIMGLVIAFTSPKEYTTSCILIPEAMGAEGKLGGSLGGLASLAGIDLGGINGGSATINPGLYRSVAQSTPFLLELMNKEFYFENLKKRVSLFEYYIEHKKTSLLLKVVSLPLRLIKLLKPTKNVVTGSNSQNNSFIEMTRDQESIAVDLRDRILVTMDWDLGVVIIEAEMQDSKVTAEIAEFTKNYITNYVENYAVSKAKEQLGFAQRQFREKKDEFEKIQFDLATFRDQNQNVTTARAKSEEERLLSKYNITFNIYNQLAQQVETIKLKVNDETPVFTMLEPIKVPIEKSSPRRALILVAFVFAAIFLSICYLVILFVQNKRSTL